MSKQKDTYNKCKPTKRQIKKQKNMTLTTISLMK